MELRVDKAEIRAADDGKLRVSGYVNKTENRSKMLGSGQKFIEVIRRGTWQRAIDNALSNGKDIHFYAEHDKNKILASTRNGSLELREDENGLYMEATISQTSWGKDYYQLIEDGILQDMSFGFRAVKDAWRNLGDYFERTVNELELFEVSVVRDPAYASSSISARGIDLVEDEVPQSELNLRTIEIRSDADIEAIAKKLFEMISANVKIAEGQQPQDETVVETIIEETVVEPETVETLPVVEDKPIEETSTEETSVEEVIEEEKVEEQVEEIVENINPEQNAADKIRDFINQYK